MSNQHLINPRGTSGSGKTTLAKAILALYDTKEDVFREGRKRPIYTLHSDTSRPDARILMALGHYEAACGGCDTITELDDVFDLVRIGLANEYDVLFEGLILSGEIARTLALGVEIVTGEQEFHVIALNTPVLDCVENVNKRRRARGVEEPVRPKNTVAKARCVELTIARIAGQVGIDASRASFDEAFDKIRGLLDV